MARRLGPYAAMIAAVAVAACVPAGSGAMGGIASPRDPLDAFQDASTTQHAAPAEPPVLQPWKVGQWAAYKMTTPTAVSVVTLRIVAEDECGTWLELESDDGEHRELMRACIVRAQDPTSKAMIARIRVTTTRAAGEVRTVGDLDAVAPTAATTGLVQLLAAAWSGQRGIKRTDVTTPAGVFLALEESLPDGNPHTRWSHPDVPITGLVRELQGTTDFVLLEYGQLSRRSIVLEDSRALLAHVQRRQFLERAKRLWVGFLFGTGVFGTLDDTTATAAFGAMLGYRLRPDLALVLDSSGTLGATSTVRADLEEQLTVATFGVRWHPYERPARLTRGLGIIVSWIYVQADLGYAQLDRGMPAMSSSTVGRGGIAGARIGLDVNQGRDWRIALELHEHTALLNGDEGVRVTAGLNAVVELMMW